MAEEPTQTEKEIKEELREIRVLLKGEPYAKDDLGLIGVVQNLDQKVGGAITLLRLISVGIVVGVAVALATGQFGAPG